MRNKLDDIKRKNVAKINEITTYLSVEQNVLFIIS